MFFSAAVSLLVACRFSMVVSLAPVRLVPKRTLASQTVVPSMRIVFIRNTRNSGSVSISRNEPATEIVSQLEVASLEIEEKREIKVSYVSRVSLATRRL